MRRGVLHPMPCVFGGKDLPLDGEDGQPAKWKVADGTWRWFPIAATSTPAPFGDCHCMWSSGAVPPVGEDQGRGQQRSVFDGPLRNPGAGFVSEQDLRRRAASAVYGISPAVKLTGPDSGRPMTYLHVPRLKKTARSCARRGSPCCTWSAGAGQRGAVGPTAHHERPPYSRRRTTAT